MIHVLHGFLGSPSDFEFLKGDEVILHDLYDKNFDPKINSEDVVIGYSMGGRIALELATKVDFNLQKLILINSNPGLVTEEEKDLRRIWEDSVLDRLKTMNVEDFFHYWNSLPIFDHDEPLAPIEEERFELSKDLFHNFRLSTQKNYLPLILKHLNRVQWIIGLKDTKYMTLAEEVLLPNDIGVSGIDGGHRLFQHPVELENILKDEGIL